VKRRWAIRIVIGLVALFLLAQAVPYGRAHDNPRPTRELRFDSARTERLFNAACGDCHSDRTTWPWYSNVAPVSWLVLRDVEGGRDSLNVSHWDRSQPSLDEILEAVREGDMPPLQYKLIHPGARLSAADRSALADGLRASINADPAASTR
jgi:mono/diheme cytochrome c family protein